MAHADNLRRHFAAVRTGVYLDTGSYGLLPGAAVEAMHKAWLWQWEEGRRTPEYPLRLQQVQQRVREHLALLLHTKSNRLALTDSTTHAVNLVLAGLPLQAGDEVIVTDAVHPAGLLAVHLQKQRRGVLVRVVDGTLPADEFVAQVERALHPRTRLVVVSQVSHLTGQRLPVERVIQAAHAAGAWVLVDGAQAAGAEDFDVEAADVDFYAFPGCKWLCGPDGTGALYVKPALWPILEPVFAGTASLVDPDAYHAVSGFMTIPHAGRYEHVRAGLATWTGWMEALQFLRVEAGWDYVFSRVHGLSGYLLDQLLSIDHVRILTPREARAGLVVFRISHVDAEAFAAECQSRSVFVQANRRLQTIRVSTGFYNTEEEIDRLVSLIKTAAAGRK